jgi:hypothetical protein
VSTEIGPDKALSTLADFTKWLTGLATAGLVFAISLQQNIPTYHAFTRWCIVAAWALYAVSVIAGVLIQSAFPNLYEDRAYTVKNGWIVGTYLAGLVALIAGSIAVFVALVSLTWTMSDPDSLRAKNAVEALGIARRQLPGWKIASVDQIELVKGADAGDAAQQSWHVKFLLQKSGAHDPDRKVDVFVNALSGASMVIAPPKDTSTHDAVVTAAPRTHNEPSRRTGRTRGG